MKVGVIVEGLNDEAVVKRACPSVEVVVTRGTRFTNRTKMDIDSLVARVEKVFIFTDPDVAGDRIAQVLEEAYGFDRLVLSTEKCKKYIGMGKWRVGVEYADIQHIREVLLGVGADL